MIIRDQFLGDQWRIKRDKYNWAVQEYSHSHKGREIWKSSFFYPQLVDAVKRIMSFKIVRKGGTYSLAEYVQ